MGTLQTQWEKKPTHTRSHEPASEQGREVHAYFIQKMSSICKRLSSNILPATGPLQLIISVILRVDDIHPLRAIVAIEFAPLGDPPGRGDRDLVAARQPIFVPTILPGDHQAPPRNQVDAVIRKHDQLLRRSPVRPLPARFCQRRLISLARSNVGALGALDDVLDVDPLDNVSAGVLETCHRAGPVAAYTVCGAADDVAAGCDAFLDGFAAGNSVALCGFSAEAVGYADCQGWREVDGCKS